MHVHEVIYWYIVELPLQDEYCRAQTAAWHYVIRNGKEVLYRCHITAAVKFYCMVLQCTAVTVKCCSNYSCCDIPQHTG
jgi:hypothetical protein